MSKVIRIRNRFARLMDYTDREVQSLTLASATATISCSTPLCRAEITVDHAWALTHIADPCVDISPLCLRHAQAYQRVKVTADPGNKTKVVTLNQALSEALRFARNHG